MNSSFRPSLTTFAASVIAVACLTVPAVAQNQPPGPPTMEQMQRMAAASQEALSRKLADMRTGLKLTPDQQRLWPPFESAVGQAFKMRMDNMQRMAGMMQRGQPLSLIDDLGAMADSMSAGAAGFRMIADSAKPLFASLDETQKRTFEMLGQALFAPERGGGGMPGPGGATGPGGMGGPQGGMMGPGPSGGQNYYGGPGGRY